MFGRKHQSIQTCFWLLQSELQLGLELDCSKKKETHSKRKSTIYACIKKGERERAELNYLTEQVILKFWARGIGLGERLKWTERRVDESESCEECKRLLVFVYVEVTGDVVRSATDMVAAKKYSSEKNQIEKQREWRRVLRENSEGMVEKNRAWRVLN